MYFTIPFVTQDEEMTMVSSPFVTQDEKETMVPYPIVTQNEEVTMAPSPFQNLSLPNPKLKTNTNKSSFTQLNIFDKPASHSTKTRIVKSHRKRNGTLVTSFKCHVKFPKQCSTGGKKMVLNKFIKSKIQWDSKESNKLAVSLDIAEKITLTRVC